jgi:drug/metabolite transporter (DMT)-like permease
MSSLVSSLSPRARGIGLAAGGMFVISTDSLITRAAEVSGFTVTFWFGMFVAPAMFGVMLLLGERPKTIARQLDRPLIVSALCQAGSSTSFIFAIKNTSIANAVVIVAAAPIVASLIAWFAIRERTTPRVGLGIVLSIAGIAIVVSGSFGGGGVFGDLLAVLAITFWSINLIIWRSHPDMNRFLAVGSAGVVMAVVSVIPADVFGHSFTTYLLLFFMGAIGGPLGRVAMASATRYISAAEVSLFTPIETLAAIVWAWIFFDEPPTVETYIGGAVVAVAFLVATVPMRSRRLLIPPAEV